MADSFNKKDREKKRRKKKQEKAERKKQRKLEGKTSEEFMYLDADGNLTPTPPDPSEKKKIKVEDIQISVSKKEESDESPFSRKGVVKFFNEDKGYGFILDEITNESFFVHVEGLIDKIRDRDKVTFDVGSGPKGPIATGVKLA